MQVYYRTSLFLYEVQEGDTPTPIIVFWRATVYSFHRGVDIRVLRRALRTYTDAELIEPQSRKAAFEKRQVPASDSRGLGFGWIEISRGEKQGLRIKPEKRVAVFNLHAFQKINARLGYAEFLGKARAYGKDKRVRLSVGRAIKSFWKWLTS